MWKFSHGKLRKQTHKQLQNLWGGFPDLLVVVIELHISPFAQNLCYHLPLADKQLSSPV